MTQEQFTKEEMTAYKRMAKIALRPENMTAALIRFVADYHHSQNIKPDCINKKLRTAIEQAPRNDGWRKKIWKYFQSTIFRNTPTDPNADQFYKYGKATSQLQNMFYGLDKIISNSPGIPPITKIFKPFLTLDKDEKREAKKSLRHFSKSLETAEKQKLKLPPSQKAMIAAGEAKGAQAVFDDNGSFIHQSDATLIYILLITFGDAIDQLPSRKAIFRFLKAILGKDMPHDEQAFNQICKRIGLKGTKGREREKQGSALRMRDPTIA